jgi:hypothetical protein
MPTQADTSSVRRQNTSLSVKDDINYRCDLTSSEKVHLINFFMVIVRPLALELALRIAVAFFVLFVEDFGIFLGIATDF